MLYIHLSDIRRHNSHLLVQWVLQCCREKRDGGFLVCEQSNRLINSSQHYAYVADLLVMFLKLSWHKVKVKSTSITAGGCGIFKIPKSNDNHWIQRFYSVDRAFGENFV